MSQESYDWTIYIGFNPFNNGPITWTIVAAIYIWQTCLAWLQTAGFIYISPYYCSRDYYITHNLYSSVLILENKTTAQVVVFNPLQCFLVLCDCSFFTSMLIFVSGSCSVPPVTHVCFIFFLDSLSSLW